MWSLKRALLAVTILGIIAIVDCAKPSTRTVSASGAPIIDLSRWLRPLPESVSDWSPLDVETWLNLTVGYPEYGPIVRAHLVDGPTLLALDVDKAFAPNHYLHSVKLKAHINLLLGRCICGNASPVDFWSYFEQHREKVLRLGSALVYTPRIAFLYIYAFAPADYNALMAPSLTMEEVLGAVNSTTGEVQSIVPWYATVLYVVMATAAPFILVAYKVMLVWSLNWFVMTFVLGFLLVEQLNDYLALADLWFRRRQLRSPVKALLSLFRYHHLVPLVLNVLAFVVPNVVIVILFIVFLLHCGLAIFSTVFGVIHAAASKRNNSSNSEKSE